MALITSSALLGIVSSTSCSTNDAAPTSQTGGSGLGGAGGISTGGAAGSNNIQCATACGAMQTCVNAACSCAAPLKACGQACANTAADGANCGACGMACPAATPLCSSSACVATCPAGLMQCGTGCVDATSFQTDPLNCGACGKACNAGLSCVAGTCGCAANQTSCSGACVDLSSNNAHCGGCDKPCAGTCQAGACMSGGGGAGGSGGGSAGAGGGGARPANCPAAPGLLSDFEEGSGVLVKQGGRDGWWYVYADPSAGTQTPASSVSALPVELLQPPGGECNKYALHSTAQSHPLYVGFGATLSPGTSAATKKAVALDAYTGITFKIRAGTGNAPPIWFEMLTKETQPADLSGTAANNQVDMYNTRGRLLEGIGTEWKTVTLPFNTLAPRYLPSGCAAGIFCEAPPFNPKGVLGFQFSLYDQFGSPGSYDLWVDDVALVTGEMGVPTYTQTAGGSKPFPRDAAPGNGCVKPTGATGKQLIEAFVNWKKTFVVTAGDGLRVVSPEIDNGATVSEGIAYGMLIAVYMNDQPLFDGLLKYWKNNSAGGMLMTWKIPGGSGSATDSDEDAAFALIQASKQWGGSYLNDAKALLAQMASSDIEANTNVLKPGNQFGGSDLTNPSYFAPAYYRLFASVDTANASKWNGVVTSTYQFLNKIEGENGLVPAWCSGSCGSRGGGGYADNNMYQYDSHRTPWRMALDVCWNDNADAKDYVNKITKTFVAKSDGEGLGNLADIYDGSGNAKQGASNNSMSIIGTAAVGAMATGDASHQAFLDRAYQFLIDASYNTDPTYQDDGYTYYNATVGLLTALTLTGNFNSF
jgi:endoglucanase